MNPPIRRAGSRVALIIGLAAALPFVALNPVRAQSSDPYQAAMPPAANAVQPLTPPSNAAQTAIPNTALPPPNIALPATPPPAFTPGQPATPATPNAQNNTQAGLSAAANIWRPRPIAVLAALDQEDGAVNRLKIPVGSSFTRDGLHVAVKACVVRPKGAIPDAAAFLTVMGAGADQSANTLFSGWLVRSEPGAAVVANSDLSFQVVGCVAQ